jgi:hypothetical protein
MSSKYWIQSHFKSFSAPEAKSEWRATKKVWPSLSNSAHHDADAMTDGNG